MPTDSSCFPPGFPDVFYKYRQWSRLNDHGEREPVALHQRVLANCEIFFASASDFNGPFDSSIPLRYDKLTKGQLLNIIESHVRADNPRFRKSEVAKRARDLYAKQNWRNLTNIDNVGKMMAERIGIFSAAKSSDNILMWSHYSASHTGFCIGVDTASFDRACRNAVAKRGPNSPIVVARWVEYEKEYPLLVPYNMTDEQKVIDPMCKKAEDWKYEKEIRLFMLNGSRIALCLPRQAIREVIFGCRMSEIDKGEIKDILTQQFDHVVLYQAEMLAHSFGLQCVKLKPC